MIYTIFTPWVNVLKDDCPQTSVEANIVPNHDDRTSPCVVLQDAVGSIPVVVPSPHFDASVDLDASVSTFFREEDVLPLPPVPVLLCPLQSLLSMS